MDPFEPLEPPPGWAADELSSFLELAHRNGYATFVKLPEAFFKLREIDALFRKVIEGLEESKDWFCGLFVLRAHSSFLGAARLSVTGQLPETYMLLRGSLESALYGFHIATKPELREIWLRRHDDVDHTAAAKSAFQIGPIFKRLSLTNSAVADLTRTLYDRTIDYGAHPNERAFSQALMMNRAGKKILFQLRYISPGAEPSFGACLRSTAHVGVGVLDVFRLVFQERFDILGISTTLRRLQDAV